MSLSSDKAVNVDLWCPHCHTQALVLAPSLADCKACATSYPVVNGTPVLINDENSVFARADYQQADSYEGASYGSQHDATSGLRGWYRRSMHMLTEFGVSTHTFNTHTAIRHVCENLERPKILVIGAGVVRYTFPADFTYTDVSLSPGLSAIADAHDLPFPDNAFDLVLAVAVLEHVVDPSRVVGEITRVLKTDGWVYAATPFLQPVHMGAYDFTRFTLLGHRRLFRQYRDEVSGMVQGPGAVAGLSVRSLLLSFSDSRSYRRVANLLGIVMSVPLKLLDHFTKRSKSAFDGAGGVFFFGQKQTRSISDRELIQQYRGGF